MVNSDCTKKKLPGLLVNGKTTKQKGWNEFTRYRYQLQQLQKRNPQRINRLIAQLLKVLEE